MKKLLTISLILCLMTSAFGQGEPMMGTQVNIAHPLSDFVAFWPMWEGPGGQVFDLSGNNNIGIFGAGAASPSWVGGKFGATLNFDGGDYVDIFNSTVVPTIYRPIGNSNNYTLIAWIKTSAAANGDEDYWFCERTIIELREEGGSGIRLPFSFGILNTVLGLGRTNSHTAGAEMETGTVAINDGIWHQVAAVVVGDTVTFYVDGVLDRAQTFTTATGNCSVGTETSNMQFGCRARDGGDKDQEFWDGEIDIPMIYNRALTDSKIALLYREPFCMFEEDLPVAQMYSYAAPPAGGGQVIFITSAIPLILIFTLASVLSMRKNGNKII